MKIIDQTPYYNHETGELSFVDRAKVIIKFGAGWIAEMEAQKAVIAVLDKVFDRNYVLLRNITPPHLEASIPLILVGPTGVYVMYITSIKGMYRAKGDQWGTVSGSSFKPEKPNLLVRAERMARAVHVYLQRQGYTDIQGAEAILLCADPSVTVDSLRPIVRVVMRDALERFAYSITQARSVYSPETVHDITNRLLAAPKTVQPESPEAAAAAAAASSLLPGQAEEPLAPAFSVPEAQVPGKAAESWNPDQLRPDLSEATTQSTEAGPPPVTAEPPPDNLISELQAKVDLPQAQPQLPVRKRRRRVLTRGQVVFLVVSALLEILLLAAFGFLVIRYSL